MSRYGSPDCGRAGLVPYPVPAGPVLLICGSYVPSTTRQLAALQMRYPSSLVEADLAALLSGDPIAEHRRLVAPVGERLAGGGLAVLCTPRAGTDGPGGHDRQAWVAQALASAAMTCWSGW